MNRPEIFRNVSRTTLSITLLTMMAALAVVVYFLPRQAKVGYEYELGKPWHYAPLIASYDFPVYKTEAEMQAERDSVLKYFQPFFEKDAAVGERQAQALREAFYSGRFANVPAYYLPHLVELFQQVYQAGILSPEDYSSLKEHGTQNVRIVSGQSAARHSAATLYSTRSAYEYIMNADTAHYLREVLLRCNINEFLQPDLRSDTLKNRQQRADLIASVSPAGGMVQSGQRIIDRGEIIKESQYKILASYERDSRERNAPSQGLWQVVAGQACFAFIILALFVIYLNLYRSELLASPHNIYLLFSLIAIFPVATSLVVGGNIANAYIIPYAIAPIFARVFMDSRTAFMTLVVTIALSSLAVPAPHEFVLLQFVAGLTAIYGVKDLTERAQLLRVTFAVTLVSLVFGLAYDLSQGVTLEQLNLAWYTNILINGVLLLFAYPLLYLIERLFGYTSSVSLIELTNINGPLLRQMSKEAQGTFNHSMQVANLAAEVANRIGAKPQLARTGALYHDIGKILNPAFFTENQSGVNPHTSLNEERSAEIIIGHVTDGLKLAEKHHLPKEIRDFIATHHGRSKVKYFYIQYKNAHPNESVDEALFTYPGPLPSTREQAIVMMCDAVEASSRSLKEFTEESIRKLVDCIVDGQVSEGCFRNCPLTFRDVTDAKQVLVDSLKTIYHTRISYPELKTAQPEEPARPARSGFFGTGITRTWKR